MKAFLILMILQSVLTTEENDKMNNKYNLLMICIDDLRDELGCYGVKEIKTPHIDQLSNSGLLFNRHYVQVPTCGSSRYSFLTGRRPALKKLYINSVFGSLRKRSQFAQSLPELFKKNGYKTVGIGKISHSPDGFQKNKNSPEIPNAWDSLPTDYGQWKNGWAAFFAYAKGRHRGDKTRYKPLMEFPDCKDNELPDGLNCELALNQLDKFKNLNQKFFLAIGFYKPHLPFVAPKKYFDMYKDVEFKPAPHRVRGKTNYWHPCKEFYKKYQLNMEESNPLSLENQIKTKKAYYACVSFVDTLVGRIMKKLRDTGLDNNTIVVLWGDHGWFLGDHGMWGKHSPLERAVKSAFIMKIPGVKSAKTNAIVETLDIYPTLVDYCNLKIKNTQHPLDGRSLRSVFNNPHSNGKNGAFSYWNSSLTVRNSRYRLIAKPQDGKWTDIELYDYHSDPNETTNIAEKAPEVVKEMIELLKKNKPEFKNQ